MVIQTGSASPDVSHKIVGKYTGPLLGEIASFSSKERQDDGIIWKTVSGLLAPMKAGRHLRRSYRIGENKERVLRFEAEHDTSLFKEFQAAFLAEAWKVEAGAFEFSLAGVATGDLEHELARLEIDLDQALHAYHWQVRVAEMALIRLGNKALDPQRTSTDVQLEKLGIRKMKDKDTPKS